MSSFQGQLIQVGSSIVFVHTGRFKVSSITLSKKVSSTGLVFYRVWEDQF